MTFHSPLLPHKYSTIEKKNDLQSQEGNTEPQKASGLPCFPAADLSRELMFHLI